MAYSDPRPSPRRIARVDVLAVEVPRRGAFDLQRGRTPATSPYTVVRITTDDGLVGYGEGDTQVRSLHAVVREQWAAALVGEDVFDLAGIHAKLERIEMMVVERVGHWNVVRCAIDTALHDLIGKALGVPIYQLLGGLRREAFDVVKNIGVSDPDSSAAAALRCVDQGFRCVKLRVGADAALDQARVAAVRRAVGDAVHLRVDANQAWTAKEAIARIRGFELHGVGGVEQPCRFWDHEANAAVVAAVQTPVIADEGFWTLHEARQLLQARAADVLHVYLGKCGGLRESMKIAAVAESFGATVTVGERVPLGIAEAAHAHYAAALPNAHFPAALAYDLNEHDLLADPLRRVDGRLHVPHGPGLGIVVDEDALRRYTRHD